MLRGHTRGARKLDTAEQANQHNRRVYRDARAMHGALGNGLDGAGEKLLEWSLRRKALRYTTTTAKAKSVPHVAVGMGECTHD